MVCQNTLTQFEEASIHLARLIDFYDRQVNDTFSPRPAGPESLAWCELGPKTASDSIDLERVILILLSGFLRLSALTQLSAALKYTSLPCDMRSARPSSILGKAVVDGGYSAHVYASPSSEPALWGRACPAENQRRWQSSSPPSPQPFGTKYDRLGQTMKGSPCIWVLGLLAVLPKIQSSYHRPSIWLRRHVTICAKEIAWKD